MVLKNKIQDTEKIFTEFGGVCLIDPDPNEDLDFNGITEANIEYRKKIIEILNNRGNVTNIQDIFDTNPYLPNLNPFMFEIHIPFSLQKELYRDLYFGLISKSSKTEDFVIIFDGLLFSISAICKINETPRGIIDARDIFIDILNNVKKVKTIPPSMTHTSIAFINEGVKHVDVNRSIYRNIKKDAIIEDVLKKLYNHISHGMLNFYVCNLIINDINKNIDKINELEAELTLNLKRFLELKWNQYLLKNNLINKIKNDTFNILIKLSEHYVLLDEYEKYKKMIQHGMESDELYNDFMSTTFVGDRILRNLNSILIMNYIENIRKEIETYQNNLITIFSAFIGAIIGSILTLVASYFFKFL